MARHQTDVKAVNHLSICTDVARQVPWEIGHRKDVNNRMMLSLGFLTELSLGRASNIIIRNYLM